MISWVVIVLLVLVGIFALRINHLRHKIFIIFFLLFVLFLYVTITIVNAQNKLDLTTTSGFLGSMKVYGGWLANGFNNIRFLSGNVVKMDWTSTNASLIQDQDNSTLRTSRRHR